MNVKYCGPALDYSGYGEANRHDIAALLTVNAGVNVELTRHCLEISEYGKLGNTIRELQGGNLPYRVKILHTTPNIYRQFIEPGIYHIARVFWETDKLPADFAYGVNMCDEVWTGSEYNAKAIRNAGVKLPIYLIPEAIDTSITPDQIKPFLTANKDDFKFYSIFEWTERKNPGVLLEAYWLEFENTQNVSLTIKTYLDDFTAAKKNEVDNYIRKIKVRLGLKNYAPIFLYRQLLSRSQMYRFHRSFNCFVSPHRGEGWGIPQMEALLMGNSIISTNCGGVHEYFKNTIDATLLDYTLTQVSNNRNGQWYQPDQQWASVEVDTVRKAMRWAFDHQAAAGETAKRGGATVRQLFSFKTVGDQMAERLRQIEETFNVS